jgi:hypothetical protein
VALPTGTRITGLRETVRDLERLGVDVADLKEAFLDISRDVVSEGQSRVRVRTGRLKSTIRPMKSKSKAVVKAGNSTSVNYGHPQDAETKFLTGPANENQGDRVATLDKHLERLIRQRNLN